MSAHKDFLYQFRYINEMMGCSCFPDLLSMKIFPDGKEITESCGAYSFFRDRQHELFLLSDSDVTCIVVGDGCTPRTGAMFAFRTKWHCHSIDPEMKWKNNSRVDRLTCYTKKVEDFGELHFEKLALIHVHSHARLEESVARFTANKRVVLSIPCCVAQERERPPDIEYKDRGIWSPENLLKVWVDF